jgi:signal transduction histidine kinase
VKVSGDKVDLGHPGSRYELFCILKEALRNVERHAGASHVDVGLVRGGGEVVLTVSDNGVGLTANGDVHALEPDGHFGLIGMAERAERLAGHFSVHGRPGLGTTIRAAVPTEEHVAPSSDQEVVLR